MRTQRQRLTTEARPPSGAREESRWFEELATKLDRLRQRAASEEWSTWTDEDTATATAAAQEIRAIPEALAQGMKEAFAAGREYGHREGRLDELDEEIRLLSSLVAQQAWGGGGSGRA
jgi:flagellar biosynthesis/type III secretory pathway protein FliH